MTTEEHNISRSVGAILVRNYVDTQKCNVDVSGTTVTLEGELIFFEYGLNTKDPIEKLQQSKKFLMLIERQIRRVPDVAQLSFRLRNWDRSGNQWIPRRR
jgi:transposase